MARDIVRKSGVRQGVGTPGDGDPGSLFTGGDPWDAITKLSNIDFEVGWRKFGLGPDMQQTWNSGPPCNLRVLQWARLRDSLLRSGASNSGRFGYAVDAYDIRSAGFGTIANPFRTWLERRAPRTEEYVMYRSGTLTGGTSTLRQNDRVKNVAKDQARIIAYVTRADWPYRFTIRLGRFPTLETTILSYYQRLYTADLSGTGRYVSDWFDFAPVDPNFLLSHGGERPWGEAAVFVTVGPSDPDSITPIPPPATHSELREGIGPFAMPFLEAEVRTVYYPESSYWVQDEHTPADYQVAQWENEV